MRNFNVWCLKHGKNRIELHNFFKKIINAYLTFLTACFAFMMTTASEIFVCTNQPNGISTMNASPDILCYNSQVWYSMLPVSIVVLVGFNAIGITFFGYMFWIREKLKEKGTLYKHRVKFIFQRFNKKFFFWGMRIISILRI